LYQCIGNKYLFPCPSYLLVFSLILVVLISRRKMIIQSSPGLKIQELNPDLEDPTIAVGDCPEK
jgi:hypothetical protein